VECLGVGAPKSHQSAPKLEEGSDDNDKPGGEPNGRVDLGILNLCDHLF